MRYFCFQRSIIFGKNASFAKEGFEQFHVILISMCIAWAIARFRREVNEKSESKGDDKKTCLVVYFWQHIEIDREVQIMTLIYPYQYVLTYENQQT